MISLKTHLTNHTGKGTGRPQDYCFLTCCALFTWSPGDMELRTSARKGSCRACYLCCHQLLSTRVTDNYRTSHATLCEGYPSDFAWSTSSNYGTEYTRIKRNGRGGGVINTHAGGGKKSTGTGHKETEAGAVGRLGSLYERKTAANISATVAVVPVWAKSINIESKPRLSHEVYKWRRNPTGTDRRLKQNKNNIEGSWINVTTMYFFFMIPLRNWPAVGKGGGYSRILENPLHYRRRFTAGHSDILNSQLHLNGSRRGYECSNE